MGNRAYFEKKEVTGSGERAYCEGILNFLFDFLKK